MLKLFRKMGKQYTFENVRLYIEFRMERYKGLEEEMNTISRSLQIYLDMMKSGQLHFQN